MQVKTIQYSQQQQVAVSNVPLVVTWNNVKMIRNHSLTSCAREILQHNISTEVVKINMIGPPSTGKTTCAKCLAHVIHKIAKSPYAVKVFSRTDLLDMEKTLAKLQPMNHVLVFDDVSWLTAGNSKAKLDQLQKTFTEIRHLQGGQDVKIIIIFNFHYSKAVPKNLRQADFYFYFDVGTEEDQNITDIVGLKYAAKLDNFKKIRHEIKTTSKEATSTEKEYHGTFSYKLPTSKREPFVYQHRKPFAPALFWNKNTLRDIVFPSREWLDPLCQTCSGSAEKTLQEVMDLKKFKTDVLEHFGEDVIRSALRLKLFTLGVNCYTNSVKKAMNYFDQYTKYKVFNLDDIVKEFGLKEEKAHMRAPLPPEFLTEEYKAAIEKKRERDRINARARKQRWKEKQELKKKGLLPEQIETVVGGVNNVQH